MYKKMKILFPFIILLFLAIIIIPEFVNASSVRINHDKLIVEVGKTKQLKIKGTKRIVKWYSKNRKIAVVSESGKVKGKKAGSTFIIAKVGDNKYRCRVTVRNSNANLSETTAKPEPESTVDVKSSEENGSDTSTPEPIAAPTATPDTSKETQTTVKNIKITIGSSSFDMELTDTDAAKELAAKLPFTIDMNELNGNEKYHYLAEAFTKKINSTSSIKAGDLMLYGDDCLVLFYKDFETSYKYTRLGQIKDAKGLEAALGKGKITIKFEIA